VRLRTTAGRILGVQQRTPSLAWSAPGGVATTHYRVQLAADDGFMALLADTGEQPVAGLWVPWPGAPLSSRQRVHWRVQVRTAEGWTPWAAAFVEAGLDPSDWLARPLGLADDPGELTPSPSPRFAAAFRLAARPTRARLYLTALGVVEAEINGQAVSDEVLAPGWTAYRHRLAYDTQDVTHLLRAGDNELAAVLGDGWYRGNLGWGDRRHRCHYGSRTALVAQLEVELGDGSRTVLATGDDGWTATSTVVRAADLYDGCSIDLTHVPRALPVAVLDEPLPRLVARQSPPVRRTAVLASDRSGSGIHDFGQNLAGWVRLRVRAREGQELVLRHAEVLVDGELALAPLRSAKATDHWVLAAGEHWLEPRFTFHGFRYAEVTTDAEVLQVEAVAVHSDLERTGEFACSDERLEQLHRNVVWGQRGNFLSVPTDCPQRDERLGWTGDAQVFAATASLLHDCHGFFSDWLADLRLEQHPDGQVPVVVPDVLTESEAGIAGWGDAAVVVPWQVAVRTGDLQVLRDALPSMRAWVDWVAGCLEDGLWLTEKQLGDWLDPDAPPGEARNGKTDRRLVANAVFVQSARLLARALELLGQDGRRYFRLASRTAEKAWERWDRAVLASQTGCALALRFGLVPEGSEAAVARRLAELVVGNGGRIGTGFLGTPEVLFALSDHDEHAAAYALLMCEDCPSWLYQLGWGATTMWERWDAIRPDGSLNTGQGTESDPGMLSFNHYAYGAVATWMHEVVAGLQVRELPLPTVVVAPVPGGGLTWARASLETLRGRAEVGWELAGATLTVTATVPAGYDARVRPPAGFTGEGGVLPAGTSVRVFSR
jgi:alpha-L-rhamnosidase